MAGRIETLARSALETATNAMPLVGQAFDLGLAVVAPSAARTRATDRMLLKATYEAARPSKHRKMSRDSSSGNALVERSAFALRNQARHLERNHDIAAGILDVWVRFVIGPEGISVEPTPKTRDGKVHADFARVLDEGFARWARRPEVTGQHDWKRTQRLIEKSTYRDGESFAQSVEGRTKFRYPTEVPFALELLEADFVPLDYNDPQLNIRQGVRCNDWGQAVEFLVYRDHPGDAMVLPMASDLKPIPARRMFHHFNPTRIGQMRGITQFANLITRLGDLKEYEEYERIAAKLSAAFTAAFKRAGGAADYNGEKSPLRDVFKVEPGMMLMDLDDRDEVQFFDQNRPNPQLEPYRDGQLKGVSAGGRVGYSSISRNYKGTYAGQRQELVEQWPSYQIGTADFICDVARPVRERWIDLALASGAIRIPREVDPGTLYDADYRGPKMPWIDPAKEALAQEILVRNRFKSPIQVIRETNGAEWRDVIEQFRDFMDLIKQRGPDGELLPEYTNFNPLPKEQQQDAA